MSVKIGDKFWVFDDNRRFYDNRRFGPIYSKHFVKVSVVGETTRSWLIGRSQHNCKKVPKKDSLLEHGIYTDETKDEQIWRNDHKHKITNFVRDEATPDQLKEIAKIIGYDTKEAE